MLTDGRNALRHGLQSLIPRAEPNFPGMSDQLLLSTSQLQAASQVELEPLLSLTCSIVPHHPVHPAMYLLSIITLVSAVTELDPCGNSCEMHSSVETSLTTEVVVNDSRCYSQDCHHSPSPSGRSRLASKWDGS